LGLGVTGMGTQIARLAGWAAVSYTVYFIHLMLIWFTFAYCRSRSWPTWSNRTVAIAYAEYAGRKFIAK